MQDRIKELENELNQSRQAEKELKVAFDELEQQRNAESLLFGKFKVQVAQKEAEYELRLNRDSFHNYFENCAVGMSVTSPTKIWLEVNQSLSLMLGYSKEELEGLTWTDITFPDDVPNNLELFSAIVNGQLDRYELDKRCIRKDGSLVYTSISTVCERNRDGSIHHLLTSYVDITERKKVEDELRILSQAVEQNPASIIITNASGQIQYVNPKFTALTGYSSKEIIGENPRILKSSSTSSDEYTKLWNTILAGGEWRGEFKNKKKCGEEYFEAALISPIKNEHGQITHLLAVKEDITRKKKDEILIRKLSEAIGQSPVSIIITDNIGKIEFVNAAFTKLTQYNIDEVVNKPPRIFNAGHIQAADFNSMWENLIAGKIWKCEYLNRRKDGSTYWEDVTISSLMNNEGAISNYILIMDDISEKKKMLDDLITAKETAEESNRLKSSFLATMNHELRTPLNHILGFSELIMLGANPDENICFASNILDSGQSLLSIIEGVFELALVENTKIRLRMQTFSLIDQFMENKASFDCILRTSDKHEQIALICKPDTSSLSRYVTTDRSKINQVLYNLFKNAVKFTEKGTIEFGYKIENESNLVFYVKDSGIGIPKEKQGVIFDYFRQGDDSFTRLYGGIGIGLAISHKIVKILNGKLTVVSEPGKGSTFSLSIPVELAAVNELQFDNSLV
jgi:PAS domain S-box-containing protein